MSDEPEMANSAVDALISHVSGYYPYFGDVIKDSSNDDLIVLKLAVALASQEDALSELYKDEIIAHANSRVRAAAADGILVIVGGLKDKDAEVINITKALSTTKDPVVAAKLRAALVLIAKSRVPEVKATKSDTITGTPASASGQVNQ
jgi:hypothetical protein